MAESWAIFRDGFGGLRLRSVKAGYNPMDLGVDRKFVTFDSTWANSFRVRASDITAGLGSTTQSVGTNTRDVKVIPISGSGPDRPTLAWMRNAGGSLSLSPSGSLPYVRGYGVCAVSMTDTAIHLSPSKALEYVYYVFTTNVMGGEGGGAGGGLFGNHPTHGPGLYIAKPSASPFSANLDDFMLTTQRNHFQIQQTGITGGATHSGVYNDPFPRFAASTLRSGFRVDLGRSYPDYPPVIAFPTDSAFSNAQRHQCSIFWESPSRFIILSSFGDVVPIRWAICSNTADYAGGTGPVVIRVAGVVGGGLYVTKKGISYPSAGAGDFLFRSDRQTPQFLGFGTIGTGAGTGTYGLPGVPPSSGIPFTFISAYWNNITGYWVGCGLVITQDFVVSAGDAFYGPAFAAVVVSSTQYKWYNSPSLSGAPFGYVTTMNVSDFS